PLVLDFMASLIGIGGRIVEAIKKGIAFIRKPVDEAIDFVLMGIKSFIKGFISTVMGVFTGKKPEKPGERPEGPEAKPGSPEAVRDAAFAAMSQEDDADTPEAAIALKEQQAAQLVKESKAALPPDKTLKITIDKDAADAEKQGAINFSVGLSPGIQGQAPIKLPPSACGTPGTPVWPTATDMVVELATPIPSGGGATDALGQFPAYHSFGLLDRAHLLGKQLGGPSTKTNMILFDRGVNRGAMRSYEGKVRAGVEEGRRIEYEVHYSGYGNSISVDHSKAVALATMGGFPNANKIPPFQGTVT